MAFPTDPIYKLIKDPETGVDSMALSSYNQVFVINGNHRFAIEYKEWLEEGNTPEAAA